MSKWKCTLFFKTAEGTETASVIIEADTVEEAEEMAFEYYQNSADEAAAETPDEPYVGILDRIELMKVVIGIDWGTPKETE